MYKCPVPPLLVLILLTQSCGSDRHNLRNRYQEDEVPSLQLLNKEQESKWRLKVLDRLWKGYRPVEDEWSEIQSLSQQDFLDRVTSDPKMTETILDFSVFMLGFYSSTIHYPSGQLSDSFAITGVPNSYHSFGPALLAANEFQEGGDFMKLFSLPDEIFLTPLPTEDFSGTSSEEVVSERMDERRTLVEGIDKMLSLLNGSAPLTTLDICDERSEIKYLSIFRNSRLGGPLENTLRRYIVQEEYMVFYNTCSRGRPSNSEQPNEVTEPKPIDSKTKETLIKAYQRGLEVIALLETLEPENYTISSLKDFRTLDKNKFKVDSNNGPSGNSWLWNTQTNSSTNMNRKRAAYVLDRFFCDDLTPVNVEVPSDHAEDVHGSSASCYSCHFKLDPMAGFFRNNGVRGTDYSKRPEIQFDDFASTAREDYVQKWKNKDGTWNIGYVKSPSDPSLTLKSKNLDNPTVEDLFEIVRNAEQTRSCITKRAFEFIVGDTVALDGGYHDYLTSQIAVGAEKPSSEQLKDVIKTLVTSNSFLEESPEKGKCYDHAPNEEAESSLPCDIAFVMKKYCLSCHSPENRQADLDLSKWTDDGAFTGIGDRDSAIEQLTQIEERLTTDDHSKRMPLNMHIDSVDLQKLYRFTVKEKTRLEQGR